MKNLHLLLFSIIVMIGNAQVPDSEKETLINFYDNNNGVNWARQDNWKSDKPVSEWYGISTKTINGIEHVTRIDFNLEENNQFITNNVKGNISLNLPELQELYLTNNQITEINLSKNEKLSEIYLNNNQLTSIDLSKNTNIYSLYLSDNQLTDFDASNSDWLTLLYLNNNQLNSIDVSKNTRLFALHLNNNNFSNIDLSANTRLTELSLNNNQFSNLDVTANTRLNYLYLDYNNLKSINLQTNTNLEHLTIIHNQLTELDLSKNDRLYNLYLGNNNLSTLTIGNDSRLFELAINDNPLTALDLRNNENLRILNAKNTNIELVNLKKYREYENTNIEISDKVKCIAVNYPGATINWNITWLPGKENNFKTDCSEYLRTNDVVDTSDFAVVLSNNELIISSKYTIKKINIYSVTGQLIKSLSSNNRNVSDLAKGVYFLQIHTDEGVFNTKVLKK